MREGSFGRDGLEQGTGKGAVPSEWKGCRSLPCLGMGCWRACFILRGREGSFGRDSLGTVPAGRNVQGPAEDGRREGVWKECGREGGREGKID